jgi:hypothetical protein
VKSSRPESTVTAATGPSKVKVAFKDVPAKIMALIVTVSLNSSERVFDEQRQNENETTLTCIHTPKEVGNLPFIQCIIHTFTLALIDGDLHWKRLCDG